MSLVERGDERDLLALLELTDPIERHRSGDDVARIVSADDDYVGDHREYVLAPFAYPSETRFSNGTYGVLYAAFEIDTAAAEVAYWLTQPYADTWAPAGMQPRKMYVSMRIVAYLGDVRHGSASDVSSAIYDLKDYTQSRAVGLHLKEQKGEGVWFDSVRRKPGECVGAFVPRVISDARPEYEVEFLWNGNRFSEFKKIHAL